MKLPASTLTSQRALVEASLRYAGTSDYPSRDPKKEHTS